MKRHWLYLLIIVPLLSGGAMLFKIMRDRANDQGLVAAEIMGTIVDGKSLARFDIRDDRGKPLTGIQKDRLCYDVLHPALKGQRVASEQIINFENGTGQVKATLIDAGGNQTMFLLSTIKGPEGVIIRASTLLFPIWSYQANPTNAANIPSAELLNRRAPFVRAAAPNLEKIGITEIKAEDGQFYPVSQLADVYAAWE